MRRDGGSRGPWAPARLPRRTLAGPVARVTERYASGSAGSNRRRSALPRMPAGPQVRPADKPERPPARSPSLPHDTGRFPNVPFLPRLGCGKLGRQVWTGRARRCHTTGTAPERSAAHAVEKPVEHTMGARGDGPVSEPDLAEIWARSLNDLADMQIEPYQRAWLQLTRPLGLVENTALIATPNEFAKDQLENRLRALITNALSRELGRNIQLAVIIDPAVTASLPASDESQFATDPLGIRMPFGTATDRQDSQTTMIATDSKQHDVRHADGLLAHPGQAEQGPGMTQRPLPLQPGPAGLPHLPGRRGAHPADGAEETNGAGLRGGFGGDRRNRGDHGHPGGGRADLSQPNGL